MNKQELIKFIEKLPFSNGPIADTVTVNRNWILKSIEQLDEPQKVVVPQFVADYIEHAKGNDWDLQDVFETTEYCGGGEFSEWFYKDGNMDLLARAWLDGYEVEKEKRYLVKMKGMQKDCVALKKNKDDGYWYLSDTYPYGSTVNFHTRKELEEAGFGWMFNCPGIEVKEVE